MAVRRKKAAVAACIAAGYVHGAGADEAGAGIEEVIVRSSRLESPASTSSRVGLTPLETPASIHVLTGDTILERGDFSIQDAVSRMVGVTDQGSSGNGGTSVSARGFSGVNSVMRLYDGVQMFVAAGTMTFPFDTWTVERIEVLGGPSSSLYGTGAIGGVVNVIPRKPSRERSSRYRLTAGSNGTYRAGVDTTGPIGDRLSYRVNASRQMSDGWADRADSESWALSASLRFDVSPKLSITLSEDYGDQRPATNSAVPLIDGRFDRSLERMNYNVLDAERRYEDSWTQVKVDWTPSESVTIRNRTYYLTADRRWFGTGGVSYDEDSGLIRRAGGSDLTHDLQQYGHNTTATWTGNLLGRTNTLAVGFDFNRLRFDHVYWVSQATTFLDPYEPEPGTYQYLPGGYNYINRFHADHQSLFAENHLELTPRLSLLTGVRTDRYDVERSERLTGVGSDASFDPGSWRVGLLHRLTPGMAVYGNYSNATDPAGSIGNMSASAQQMKMMKGEQVEIGLKQSFAGGRGEWTAAMFRIVKNDLQIAVPDQPGVRQQVGQQSSRGIELTASLTVAENVRLDMNATAFDARFDDFAENVNGVYVTRDGNTPRNIPERTANVWVDWSFLPRWHARAGVRYVGERQADNANSRTLDSFTVVDGSLRFNVSESSMLDFRVFNASDLFYVPRGSSATSWNPAPGRTTELSWTSSF